MQKQPLEIKAFPLIRLNLALHIVPRIRYLGFTLVCLRVQMKLDMHLHRQQAPFSVTVVMEQVLKIQYSLHL
jgi:hypothetical protein